MKKIQEDGWTEKNQVSSYKHFVHPSKPGKVTVSVHSGKDLEPRTVNSIQERLHLN
ncbi:MAG: type II toxin-antitoxin system HicA family toxin [Oscillospiraceae bacterium]